MSSAAAGALALALALALGGCGSEAPRPKPASTLAATYVDRNGDGVLERGGGEGLMARTELAPVASRGRQLALFAQISDAHLADEESPARPTFLDRLNAPFNSTFRPQEALGARVLAATVDSVNGLRPDAVVETGDLIDNAQANELDQALAVVGGGRVDPGSGRPGYEGVQRAGEPDPSYYRPGVDAPRAPGLLDRAQRPFRSAGLKAPWYPVAGNHDLLVQGEAAPTARTEALATGDRAVETLDSGALQGVGGRSLDAASVDRFLRQRLGGRTVPRARDPRRRELSPAEALSRLRAASRNGSGGGLLDYSFDIGPRVRAIVLDAVDRTGGSKGLIRPAQLAWLATRLRNAGGRYVVVFSHQPLRSSRGGAAALRLLDRSPRVVAAIAGHTHRSTIEPRRSRTGGYWLVTAPSLTDFPQQARAFRLSETPGGGAVLDTWLLDHRAGEPLADTSLELSFLDAQGGRPQHFAGARADRNAALFLRSR